MLGLEIVDESDEHEDMQTLAREVWKVRAEEKGLFETTSDTTNSGDDAENSK